MTNLYGVNAVNLGMLYYPPAYSTYASWRIAMGQYLDTIVANKGNVVELLVLCDTATQNFSFFTGNSWWVRAMPTEFQSNGFYTWGQLAVEFSSLAHARGLLVEFAPQNQPLPQQTYMFGSTAAQDTYISELNTIIDVVHPDIVNLVNEPNEPHGDYPTPEELAQYIAALHRIADGVLAHTPTIKLGCMAMPHWDVKPFLAAGGMTALPADCILFFHIYYTYWPSRATEWSAGEDFSADGGWRGDYWNGRFAAGKIGFTSDIMGAHGIAAAQALGKTCAFEMFGSKDPGVHNELKFLEDAAAVFNTYSIGWITDPDLDFPVWNSVWGFANSTTLDAYGQVLFSSINYTPSPVYDTTVLVQGPFRGEDAAANSVAATYGAAPTLGNVLVAVIGYRISGGSPVTSITQTNVAWTLAKASPVGGAYNEASEIWLGIPSASPGTSVTVHFTGSPTVSVVNLFEWSNLDTAALVDKVGSASGLSSTPSSGTTATTTYANELIIAGICNGNTVPQFAPNPSTFTLIDGTVDASGYFMTLSALYSEVDAVLAAQVSTSAASAGYSGCIVTLKIKAQAKLNPAVPVPTLTDPEITLGASMTAEVTIAGAGASPAGTVIFEVYIDSVWVQIGATKTLSSAAATSDSYTPLIVGQYPIRVIYSGNTVYNGLTGAASILTVNAVPPTTIVCPTTIISTQYDEANSFDAATGIAKMLNKDFWSE